MSTLGLSETVLIVGLPSSLDLAFKFKFNV